MNTNHYFISDIISNFYKYLKKQELLDLISTCKVCRQSDNYFFKNYYINYKSIYRVIFETVYDDNLRTLLKNFLIKIVKLKNTDNLFLLKHMIKLKCIDISYYKKIGADDLPNSIRTIKLPRQYDQPLDNLPDTINEILFKKLIFSGINDHRPYIRKFPKNLKMLVLPDSYDHKLDNLPDGLKILETGEKFNQNLNQLPDGLLALTTGYNFSKPLNYLPSSLKYLKIGHYFDHPIDFRHLSNLAYLEFGNVFNQSVDKLPQNLKHVIFGINFNRPLDDLPDSVQHITIGSSFNQELIKLPKSLKTLTLVRSNIDTTKINKDIKVEYLDDRKN